MNEVTNEAILNVISVLLVIGAFAVCVLFYFAYDMEQDMKRIQEGERDTDPQPYTPDPEHIKRILDEWELRKPLKQYKNMEHAAQAGRTPEQQSQYDNYIEEGKKYPAESFTLASLSKGRSDPYVPHVTDVRMP